MNLLSRIKLNLYDDRATKQALEAGEYTFQKLPDNILDLGAHKGFATEYFARLYPRVPIDAYEPNPKLYKSLQRRTRKYPNVRTFNEAISDHDGTVSFAVSERNVSSHIGEGSEVPCVSLRTAVARTRAATVSIKCDIEGAEFDAFKDIPQEVIEIVGEVHPQKTTKNIEEFRADLNRFDDVTVPDDKAIFHAV